MVRVLGLQIRDGLAHAANLLEQRVFVLVAVEEAVERSRLLLQVDGLPFQLFGLFLEDGRLRGQRFAFRVDLVDLFDENLLLVFLRGRTFLYKVY